MPQTQWCQRQTSLCFFSECQDASSYIFFCNVKLIISREAAPARPKRYKSHQKSGRSPFQLCVPANKDCKVTKNPSHSRPAPAFFQNVFKFSLTALLISCSKKETTSEPASKTIIPDNNGTGALGKFFLSKDADLAVPDFCANLAFGFSTFGGEHAGAARLPPCNLFRP